MTTSRHSVAITAIQKEIVKLEKRLAHLESLINDNPWQDSIDLRKELSTVLQTKCDGDLEAFCRFMDEAHNRRKQINKRIKRHSANNLTKWIDEQVKIEYDIKECQNAIFRLQ